LSRERALLRARATLQAPVSGAPAARMRLYGKEGVDRAMTQRKAGAEIKKTTGLVLGAP
jgi:hypothetical protein